MTLTKVVVLFSLVPLVWESSPKLQGVWCKPNHQTIGGSDPKHQGIWSPPREEVLCVCVCVYYCVCVCVYYCRTYYKAVRGGGGGEWRTCAMRDDEQRPVWMSLPITLGPVRNQVH